MKMKPSMLLSEAESEGVSLGGGSLEIGSLCSFFMLKGNKKFSVGKRGRQLGGGFLPLLKRVQLRVFNMHGRRFQQPDDI